MEGLISEGGPLRMAPTYTGKNQDKKAGSNGVKGSPVKVQKVALGSEKEVDGPT